MIHARNKMSRYNYPDIPDNCDLRKISIKTEYEYTNSLPLLCTSKYLYIIDVLYYSDVSMGSNTQFKQILIDLDNYKALKELGKTGDSFNNVIRDLLNKTTRYLRASTQDIENNDLIEMNADNKSFILKIDSGLRKVGVNRIIGFRDHLEIDFLDEAGVNIVYPRDLQEIPREIGSALLNSNLRLPNYAIKRIVKYFQEYMFRIERMANTIRSQGS